MAPREHSIATRALHSSINAYRWAAHRGAARRHQVDKSTRRRARLDKYYVEVAVGPITTFFSLPRAASRSDVPTVDPTTSIKTLVHEQLTRTDERTFPVVEDEVLVGLIPRKITVRYHPVNGSISRFKRS